MSSILKSGALTTYAAAKRRLNKIGTAIVDATDQEDVERLINAVSDAVEKYCGRQFAKISRTETLPAPRGKRLQLKHTPIFATPAIAITIDGVSVDADDFELEHAELGWLHREVGWGGTTYEDLISGSVALATMPGTGQRVLAVTYTGGYVMPSEADALNDRSITVTHVGTGTGTIAVTGSVAAAHTIVCTVAAGAATMTVAVDGGAPVTVAILAGSALDIGTSYPGLSALDGLTFTYSSTGTWVQSDTFSFSTPAVAVNARTEPWDLEDAVLVAIAMNWRGGKSGSAKDERVPLLPDDILPTLDRYHVVTL